MSRVRLPITDYVGDKTSVLDQSIRIIQASIDVLAELGHLSSCLQMAKLLQCIKSARWPTDPPLSILPGVDPEQTEDTTSLQQLSSMGKDQWAKKASGLSVPASQVTRFTRAASLLPDVKVAVGHVTALSIVVSLSRLNAVVEREARIYAPEFPKPQTEGWFVIVGNLATDQVFAVKRVSWSAGGGRGVGVGSKPSARAVIKLPEPQGAVARKVDVMVVSDGYVGLEYRVLGVEIPAPPTVDDGASKKALYDGPS